MRNFTEGYTSFILGIMVVVVASFFLVFFFGTRKITVEKNTANAQDAGLLNNIEKFEDAGNTCYVLRDVWLKFGGISCVKK